MYATEPLARAEASIKYMVASHLREAILYGDLKPGEKLVERALCEQLGVSRTAFREAMQHLQAEGLVEVIPYKGLYVATISRREAEEMFAVREILENHMAQEFTRNATPKQVEALEESIHDMRQWVEEDGSHELLRVKQQIYTILLEGCGNTILADIHTQLNNRIAMLRRTSLAKPGRRFDSIQELEEILAAIRRGDAEEAGRLCAAHVRAAANAAFAGMDQ